MTPPAGSVAVPETATGVPVFTFPPYTGDVIVDIGGVVSIDWVAGRMPGCGVAELVHVRKQVYRRLLHVGLGLGLMSPL